ncbi:MAG: hypothetical protein LBF56_03615 [Holosporales bacterium]|jgi:hypothetical protein|nr:hypothetical protein [Holosporales bacterium]
MKKILGAFLLVSFWTWNVVAQRGLNGGLPGNSDLNKGKPLDQYDECPNSPEVQEKDLDDSDEIVDQFHQPIQFQQLDMADAETHTDPQNKKVDVQEKRKGSVGKQIKAVAPQLTEALKQVTGAGIKLPLIRVDIGTYPCLSNMEAMV